jgi:hypothetical protein
MNYIFKTTACFHSFFLTLCRFQRARMRNNWKIRIHVTFFSEPSSIFLLFIYYCCCLFDVLSKYLWLKRPECWWKIKSQWLVIYLNLFAFYLTPQAGTQKCCSLWHEKDFTDSKAVREIKGNVTMSGCLARKHLKPRLLALSFLVILCGPAPGAVRHREKESESEVEKSAWRLRSPFAQPASGRSFFQSTP